MISCICYPNTKGERDKQISGSSSRANLANQRVPGHWDLLSQNVKVERSRGKHSTFKSSFSHAHTCAYPLTHRGVGERNSTYTLRREMHVCFGLNMTYPHRLMWWIFGHLLMALTLKVLETWWDGALLKEVVTFVKVFLGLESLSHPLLPVSYEVKSPNNLSLKSPNNHRPNPGN